MNLYDNSQVVTYQACPRKYYYQYVRGLIKEDTNNENMDLRFGSAFHNFMDTYFSRQEVDLNKIWAEYQEPIGELTKTQQGGIFLCEEYMKANKQIDDMMNVIKLETRIDFPVGKHMFTVKPDGIVEINGNIYSLEHKTTGNLSYTFFTNYKMNSQITAQCYATRHDQGQCSGVIINAAEIRFLKRKSAQREAGFNAKFDRDIMNRTDEEMDQWYDNVNNLISMIEASKEHNYWVMNDGGSSCNQYRGCPYKEICRSCNNEEIIETMYVQVEDPLYYLKPEKGGTE